VSVLNWNEREMTLDCLETLTERTEYENFQIVVVDNGSTDGSVSAFRDSFPDVEIVENETNRGFGPAHNQVLTGYDADYYVLFNNDAEATDGWLGPLVDYAEANPEVGVIGPRIEFPDGRAHTGGSFGPFGGDRRLLNPTERISGPDDVNWVSGAVFCMTSDVIADIGTMDEIFAPIYFEEVDFCWRAIHSGYRVVFHPGSTVRHDGSSDGDDSERLIHLMRKHGLTFRLINYPARWLPAVVFEEAKEFAFGLTTSDRVRRTKQFARAYRDLWRERSEILEKRSEREGLRP
jgi:GT2 family glycosyltransferase